MTDTPKDQDETLKAEADASLETEENTPKPSSGKWVWILFFFVLIGGGAWVTWPVYAPEVRPVIDDVKAALGLDAPASDELAVVPQEPAPDAPAPVEEAAPAEIVEDTAVQDSPVAAPDGPDVVIETPAIETPVAPEPVEIPKMETPVPTLPGAAAEDVDALKRDVAALQDQLAQARAELSALTARLDEVERAPARAAARSEALVLAVTQLRSRLLGEGPFAAELDILEGLAEDNAALADAVGVLRSQADIGIPQMATLSGRFASVEAAVLKARSGEGEGWVGTVKDGLSGLITVRRTDPGSITDPVDRALAEAKAALNAGDLASAVQALEGLTGKPAEAALVWISEARARVEAEAALEVLHTEALSMLARGGA